MAKSRKSFPLRMDPDLFDSIRSMAEQEMRSVNAQIEFMLRDAVAERGRKPKKPNDESENDA